MNNIEQCFTSYPDYQITTPTLRQMVPTCRPDYSGYETRRLLHESRELNKLLSNQLADIQERMVSLERYMSDNESDGK